MAGPTEWVGLLFVMAACTALGYYAGRETEREHWRKAFKKIVRAVPVDVADWRVWEAMEFVRAVIQKVARRAS